MGTTMCVPLRRREESPLSYFGIPVSTLAVYEQRVVQQSTSYIPGIPVLLQDIAFYWDSQVEGDAAVGKTAAVSPDSIWIAAVEKTINEFARNCKLFSFRKNTRAGKGSGDAKKKSFGKYASRVFEKPFHALMGKMPLRAPHFVAILTLFLRKLPEPLLTSLFVRQMEDILGNKTLTEEEKAQALQKSSRQTFLSTHPAEHAVYQYLKQLVQRHRAELIAAEVEMLAHAMAREPTEQVTEFILQQLRPVVGPVLPTPKREVLTDNKTELNAPSDATPRALTDVAGGAEEAVPYSAPGSPHADGTAREAHASTHGTSAGSSHSASARGACSDKAETNGGKQKKKSADGNLSAEGGTGKSPSTRYADSATSSSSSDTKATKKKKEKENSKTSASRGEGVSAASKYAKVVLGQTADSSSTAGDLAGPKNLAATPHREALFAESVQAADTSDAASIEAASAHVAGGGGGVANKATVEALSGPCDAAKLEEKPVRRRQQPPQPCMSSGTSRSLLSLSRAADSPVPGGEVKDVDGAEGCEKQQQLPPRRMLSCLQTPSPHAQPAGSLLAATLITGSSFSSPIACGGKEPHDSAPRFFAEQHPRCAALLGAKQLFLGKQLLPAKQIQSETRQPWSPTESVEVKAKGSESEPLSTRQGAEHATEAALNDTCGQPLPHDTETGFFPHDDTDRTPRVQDEEVLPRVIQPLVAKLEQLTARCAAFEQLLRASGTLAPPQEDPQAMKQVVEEVTHMKEIVRQLVESSFGSVEDIQNLQRKLEEQAKRLECNKAAEQSWRSEALSAKEMALEAQRRCADLQKAQIQNHQSCQYMSLKLRELAAKLEHGEKESLDLKVELSTLQRQAVLMREKLLSTR
ncbi:putative C-terminal motor kinesin [Trypanosoma conorhini]|uniref:Putative C-terminal motor kinesin n=1 Tax=Trypanosoma conorhini TaxID=83891 RepID=A0A3R7NCP4_9TRYP|nr:putative C-terminal motor kinesin [Trypanosoma conorhini]RNF20140.1 putative C-terminal motor kinesin [Trypanosoma conorhini]